MRLMLSLNCATWAVSAVLMLLTATLGALHFLRGAGHAAVVMDASAGPAVVLGVGSWEMHEQPFLPTRPPPLYRPNHYSLYWTPVASKGGFGALMAEAMPRFERAGKKPGILFIGDSISRNMLRDTCYSMGLMPTLFLLNHSEDRMDGGHYVCAAAAFEMANFFIWGASLDGPYFEEGEGAPHGFPGMPTDTRSRFSSHLASVRDAFSQGYPDVVVLNSMFWDLGRLEKHDPHAYSTFNTSLFQPFAESWLANMTWMVERVRELFPEARSVLLQANLVAGVQRQGALAGPATVLKMNSLMRLLQRRLHAQHSFLGLLDLAAMTDDLPLKFQPDEAHPNALVNYGAVEALLNLAACLLLRKQRECVDLLQ